VDGVVGVGVGLGRWRRWQRRGGGEAVVVAKLESASGVELECDAAGFLNLLQTFTAILPKAP
jgi:hypothetical protein